MDHFFYQGTELDNRDLQSRTPLLLAASKQGWNTVKMLISKGADMSNKDLQNRNFLHLATLHGAKLKDLGIDFCKVKFTSSLRSSDKYKHLIVSVKINVNK